MRSYVILNGDLHKDGQAFVVQLRARAFAGLLAPFHQLDAEKVRPTEMYCMCVREQHETTTSGEPLTESPT